MDGFTLLELILVMLIMCTVLAMASISLRGFFASRRTADAAAQMVALTQYARTQATAEGRVYRVNLDTESGRYWLSAQEGGTFARVPSEFGRVFLLPEGTKASWLEPSDTGSAGFVPFYPDGRTLVAHIRLSGRQGERADVVCLSPAERFHVAMPSEGETP